MADVAPAPFSRLDGDSRRKSSKHGDASKKRHRDASQTEKAERKHKKSRRDSVPEQDKPAELVESEAAPKHKRKSHKSSKATDSHINGTQSQDETAAADVGVNGADAGEGRTEKKKKHRKESKESKKSKKKSKEPHDQVIDDDDMSNAPGHPDVVVLSSSRSKKFPDPKLTKHRFPFYTQTVSQYLPLHPLGINEPLHGYMNQHLEPLLNRYVPSFGGVLLAYRNPRIGEAPGSGSLTENSGMDDTVIMESINEHGVTFGWLTVEIDIFQPSRGAWLEGLVNIQSEGHIGVVCWGKFNASIESGRLPRDWRWVDQHTDSEGQTASENTSDDPFGEDNAEPEHTEVHATGYWVDGQGAKITSESPICFRIKNYEVGSSGDYGYLSIEGTMLTTEEEDKKVHKEIEILKGKLKQGPLLRRDRRRVPELGITKFGDDEQEQESQQTGV
ncbi:hypothetical protein O1611_g8598 [Lasiodiplodia mahajangana]|uniref:Uncharacterized protein n=1 Tax=Lasiodiplodia mahajangana TaxID=1108764 RepID=A0ACC2JCE2_9PEZI|nr:hypothetical protein O1611_g8598 [Lasiodiplodia mahajangana]